MCMYVLAFFEDQNLQSQMVSYFGVVWRCRPLPSFYRVGHAYFFVRVDGLLFRGVNVRVVSTNDSETIGTAM